MKCDCGHSFEPVIQYQHRLICGDCTDAAVVARVMGDDTPNLILADPPYGVNIVAANGYVGGGEGPNGMIPFGGKKRGYVGGGDRIKASPGLYPIETFWLPNGLAPPMEPSRLEARRFAALSEPRTWSMSASMRL